MTFSAQYYYDKALPSSCRARISSAVRKSKAPLPVKICGDPLALTQEGNVVDIRESGCNKKMSPLQPSKYHKN
jgi:hypothetical protein